MVKVSRRDFLKISAGTGIAATLLNKDILDRALALIFQNLGAVKLVWLNGQACSGCSISAIQYCENLPALGAGGNVFAGGYATNLFQVLFGVPNGFGTGLEFMETLMPQAGCYYSDDGETYSAYSMSDIPGDPIDETYVDAMQWMETVLNGSEPVVVIVEGAIPYERWGDNKEMGFCEVGMKDSGMGTYKEMWNFAEIIKHVHEKSSVVAFVAYGNCGSFGGIPGGNPNPTGAKGLLHFLEDAETSEQFGPISSPHKPVINLDGCPAKPEHLVLVYAAAIDGLLNGSGLLDYIELDRWNRPVKVTLHDSSGSPIEVELFKRQVHDMCERKRAFDAGDFAFTFEEAIDNPEKCLLKLGCRGVDSFNSCSEKGGYVGGPWSANRWNPNGIGSWNKDRGNPIGGVIDQGIGNEVNPGMWCVAAGSPCNGCSTTTYPDNVLGRGFFIECTHSEMLDACELPGQCSSAPELQGLTCYTCHSVTMPRKYKKWITHYGYGYEYGPYYP